MNRERIFAWGSYAAVGLTNVFTGFICASIVNAYSSVFAKALPGKALPYLTILEIDYVSSHLAELISIALGIGFTVILFLLASGSTKRSEFLSPCLVIGLIIPWAHLAFAWLAMSLPMF